MRSVWGHVLPMFSWAFNFRVILWQDRRAVNNPGMPIEAYYDATVFSFLKDDTELILGVLTAKHHHTLEERQRWAWLQQISILKASLATLPDGRIFLEFYIPRMGKRADVILIEENIVFVIEFKAGDRAHFNCI